MRHYLDKAGNLVVVASNSDRSEIAHYIRRAGAESALYMAFESIIGNSDLDWIPAEDIGALTDSPIIGESSVRDDGTREVWGRVWWFPDYQTRDPAEDLARRGRAVFTLAPTST